VVSRTSTILFRSIGQSIDLFVDWKMLARLYVVDKNLQTNEVFVASGHDHPALYRTWLQSDDFVWIAGAPPSSLVLKCLLSIIAMAATCVC